jgi:hypothetical protein
MALLILLCYTTLGGTNYHIATGVTGRDVCCISAVKSTVNVETSNLLHYKCTTYCIFSTRSSHVHSFCVSSTSVQTACLWFQ